MVEPGHQLRPHRHPRHRTRWPATPRGRPDRPVLSVGRIANASAFVDPYRFDITRSPNPHVAFGGGGPHYCLGASLARSEIQVMMGELLRRFETIEITGDPVWLSSGPAINVGVAVQSLPVRLAY